jgi:hypothetical protein
MAEPEKKTLPDDHGLKVKEKALMERLEYFSTKHDHSKHAVEGREDIETIKAGVQNDLVEVRKAIREATK